MYYEMFSEIVSDYGGASCKFCQGNYLSDFSGIKAKRLSSNLDTVVYGNFSADNGLCFGFTLLMIEKYFNFGGFLSTIETAEGKGKVRGYSFLQCMRALTKTGKSKSNAPIGMREEGRYLELITDSSEAASFALAKDFERMGFVRSDTCGVAEVTPFIRTMANHYFYLSVRGSVASHAIALVSTSDGFGVFDSNLGMATFYRSKGGSTKRFCSFLDVYTKHIYSGMFSYAYCITAFKSKKRPIVTMRMT